MLGKAKNVVEALDTADNAQNKANEAIQKANVDIDLAKSDLEQVCGFGSLLSPDHGLTYLSLQIDGQTGDAQTKATDTANTVLGLAKELNDLQKKLAKNELDARDINLQTDKVKESANNAHESATQLRNEYKTANESLATKAKTSESARERATALLQRASRITLEATGKLQELQKMTNIYNTNEYEIAAMEERIGDLNIEMTNYLNVIRSRADWYRECPS